MADPVLGYDDEELVAVVVDERNWKGIGISLLVIVTIFSFIGLSIFILTPKTSEEDWGRFRINLTDLIGPHLKPHHVKATWVTGNELISSNSEGSIVMFDVQRNGSRTTLIPSSKISQFNVQKFSLSPDRKYILLEIERSEPINSSHRIDYKVYNLSSSKLVSLEEIIQPLPETRAFPIDLAIWTRTGNSFLFVMSNDIYYCPGVGKESNRLTNTGKPLAIYNGQPDWFYKEFLHFTEAIWISKDGSSIIYATFNDTRVDLSPINIYGPLYQSKVETDSTPQVIYQRYPKAGRPIPSVSLWFLRLSDPGRSLRPLTEPVDLTKGEKYLTHVSWFDSNTVLAIWTLRSQNFSLLVNCSSQENWNCRRSNLINDRIHRVKSLRESILTLNNPSKHFIIIPKPDLKIGQFDHIAQFNPQDKYFNSIGNFLTHGRFDVRKLLAYDSGEETLYFLGTGHDRPASSQVYSLRLNNLTFSGGSSLSMIPLPVCITCNKTADCTHYEADFSPTIDYYLLRCLGPRKVFSSIYSTTNHSLVTMIEDNKKFEEALMDKRMPREMYLTLPIDDDSRRLNIKVLVPPPRRHLEMINEEEEDNFRYPMVIESFPMVDLVLSDKFNLHWGHYLSSSKEYVYVQLELHEVNPVTSSRDYRWSKVNYDHQLAVIDLIDSLLGNIDRTRVVLWGTASSAFTALETLSQDRKRLIACAIGQSPIVDWRLMDAVSAEYLFGNPNSFQFNSNYDLNNLFLKTEELVNRRFLIAHGTANEFVSIQHTMLLTKSLIKESNGETINYQIQIYPDDNHLLSHSKLHFLLLIENYLHRCFTAVHAELLS